MIKKHGIVVGWAHSRRIITEEKAAAWQFCIRMIKKKDCIEQQILGGMDALKKSKWMIIRFTPCQTTTLPKWMFFQKRLFN